MSLKTIKICYIFFGEVLSPLIFYVKMQISTAGEKYCLRQFTHNKWRWGRNYSTPPIAFLTTHTLVWNLIILFSMSSNKDI